jgi:hypothetical protein
MIFTRPGRGAGNYLARVLFQRPCRGANCKSRREPVGAPSLRSASHRLLSAAPPGQGMIRELHLVVFRRLQPEVSRLDQDGSGPLTTEDDPSFRV